MSRRNSEIVKYDLLYEHKVKIEKSDKAGSTRNLEQVAYDKSAEAHKGDRDTNQELDASQIKLLLNAIMLQLQALLITASEEEKANILKKIDNVWAKIAAESKFSEDIGRQRHLIVPCEKGRYTPQYEEKAFKWYTEKAEQGNIGAQLQLGLMYANGQGDVPSDEQAVKWFKKAAEQGHPIAQYELANRYASGRGVSQSDEHAFEWYVEAAEQEYALAQFQLGCMYANGQGVAQSLENAFKCYTKSAEQGHIIAQYNLGVMYRNGHGISQSDEEAVKWYGKAADQGLAIAQHNLGFMYDNGRGVAQSDEKAVTWYRKAAEQGCGAAQYSLGNMYRNGKDMPQSDEEAIQWYTNAVEQGHANARLKLELMYANRQGYLQTYENAFERSAEVAAQDDAEEQKEPTSSFLFEMDHIKNEMRQIAYSAEYDDETRVSETHRAAFFGDYLTLNQLLENQSEPVTDYAGRTPLHYAACCQVDEDKVVEMIYSLRNSNAKYSALYRSGRGSNRTNRSPLHFAAASGKSKLLAAMIIDEKWFGWSMTIKLLPYSFLNAVDCKVLHQECCDQLECNSLHYASQGPDNQESARIVHILLANVRSEQHEEQAIKLDRDKATALHLAVSDENLAVVKALLSYHYFKRLINERDNTGRTPIFYAFKHRAIWDELLNAGANTDSSVKLKDGSVPEFGKWHRKQNKTIRVVQDYEKKTNYLNQDLNYLNFNELSFHTKMLNSANQK